MKPWRLDNGTYLTDLYVIAPTESDAMARAIDAGLIPRSTGGKPADRKWSVREATWAEFDTRTNR